MRKLESRRLDIDRGAPIGGSLRVRQIESSRLIRSIRLSDHRLQQLLDSLDAGGQAVPAEAARQRKHERVACRLHAVVLRITHRDEAVNFLVPTRNISRGGLGFLHGSMLHQGTPCKLMLVFKDGRKLKADGTVARCRHVSGMIYEVGVKFDREIDLQDAPVDTG